MTPGIVVKAVVVWSGILLLAIGNGAFREAILIPALGAPGAFLASGLLLSVLIFAAAFVCLPWMGTRQQRDLVLIGLAWLSMTLIFEFSFGLARGKELDELLEAYSFRDGNLWPMVLMITAAGPWLAGKLRGWA